MNKIKVLTPDGGTAQIDPARYDELQAKFTAKYGKPFVPADDDAKEAIRVAKIGAGRSAIEGAKQGVTANFADEIAGVGGAIAEKLAGADVDPSFKPSFREAYVRERDAARKVSDDAAKANPKANLAGALAGGLASSVLVPGMGPLKAAAGAGKATRAVAALAPGVINGALMGVAQGAGAAKELEDIPVEAAHGGILGGGLGLGLGALGAAGRKVLAPLTSTTLRDSAKKADELRALTFSGDTGGSIATPPLLKEIKRVPGGVPEFARVQRALGLAPKLGTTQGLLDKATVANDEANRIISGIISGVDDAGGKVDIKAFAKELVDEADAMAKRPELADVAEALRGRAARYLEAFPEGATMREAQTLKDDLGNRVNWVRAAGGELPNAQEGARLATRAMTSRMDEAATDAFRGKPLPADIADDAAILTAKLSPGGVSTAGIPDAGAAYQAARRASQVTRIGKEAAEESTGRASKRGFFSLGDKALAQAGATVGGAIGGGGGATAGAFLAPLLSKGARPYAASARATAAETAASIVSLLDRYPGTVARLGKGGEMIVAGLRDAAQRGPQALLVAHEAAMRNPDYVALVKAMERKR